jgi:hypothetical protein
VVAEFLISVVPSVGVLFLFVIVVRALFQADRRERLAQARIEAEQDRAAAGNASAGDPPMDGPVSPLGPRPGT